jgi:hypothetical protein
MGKSRESRAANPCPAGCPKAFIASLALCNAVDTVVGLGVRHGWICAGKIGICEGFQVHSIIQMVLGIYKVYIYIYICFEMF